MKTYLLAAVLLGAATLAASGTAAERAQLDLFTARQGGYETYRIPGLVATAKGTLLAYCEARRSARSDWGEIDILLRRSTDGGQTWSEPAKLGKLPAGVKKNEVATAQKLGQPDQFTMNNPVAIAAADGTVHFLYCVEYARSFYMRSKDDGATFSAPVEITAAFEPFRKEYAWKVLATGPGHGLALRNGRLVVPVWLSTGTGGHAHRPSAVSTIYSDDAGQTWQRGEIITQHGDDLSASRRASEEGTPTRSVSEEVTPTRSVSEDVTPTRSVSEEIINPSETILVELSDGRVMANIRSESKANRRLVTTSPDGATKWTKPKFDDALVEPICMASLVRVDGKHIAFSNPANLLSGDKPGAPGKGRDRKNLTVRLSDDDGATWKRSRVLSPGISAYSDLASDGKGTIYCFYENGGVDGQQFHTAALTFVKLTLADFEP